jgi:hypothetical protein
VSLRPSRRNNHWFSCKKWAKAEPSADADSENDGSDCTLNSLACQVPVQELGPESVSYSFLMVQLCKNDTLSFISDQVGHALPLPNQFGLTSID